MKGSVLESKHANTESSDVKVGGYRPVSSRPHQTLYALWNYHNLGRWLCWSRSPIWLGYPVQQQLHTCHYLHCGVLLRLYFSSKQLSTVATSLSPDIQVRCYLLPSSLIHISRCKPRHWEADKVMHGIFLHI